MKKTDRVMTVEKGQRLTHRVYFTEGISPTIVTPGGGGHIPKIIEMKEEPKIVSYSRDKKGKIENYHTKEVANTIHCSTGSKGNTAQYVLEPKPIADPFVVASRGREPNVLIQTRPEEAKRLRKD